MRHRDAISIERVNGDPIKLAHAKVCPASNASAGADAIECGGCGCRQVDAPARQSSFDLRSRNVTGKDPGLLDEDEVSSSAAKVAHRGVKAIGII